MYIFTGLFVISICNSSARDIKNDCEGTREALQIYSMRAPRVGVLLGKIKAILSFQFDKIAAASEME